MQKQIYVVIGLGRSGTSAITNGLNALNISLGNQFNRKNTKFNANGSWEDTDIARKVNRRVLDTLDYNFSMAPTIKEICKDNAALQPLHKIAAEIIKGKMLSTNSWAFKDPNTSKILPFWQSVFNELALEDNYIIALRNPLAVAHSFQRVAKLDLEASLINWLVYLVSAIDGTENKKRVLVSFDAILANPQVQLERIKNQLSITNTFHPEKMQDYITSFINHDLKHYEYTINDLKTHAVSQIAPLCVDMYELLCRVANDEINLNSDEFSSAWQPLRDKFIVQLPIYGYIDTLLKRNADTTKTLRKMQKLIAWKLSLPLRWIENIAKNVIPTWLQNRGESKRIGR